MKPTVLIFGDSWACGEWPEGPSLTATHKGIEEYFKQENYNVKNFARGGCCNKDSVSMLGSELSNHLGSDNIVIWVQTDPIRNLQHFDYAELSNRVQRSQGIINLIAELLEEDYNSINQLAKQHNCKVYAVGGLSSIQTCQLINYPYIECLLESWVHLLVGYKSDYVNLNWNNYNILDSDWTVQHLKFNTFSDQALKNKCIDEMYQMNLNRVVYKDPIFSPNGNHPNREGHRILFNYIKEKLKL